MTRATVAAKTSALHLDPACGVCHTFLASTLLSNGQLQAALTAAQQARRVDPWHTAAPSVILGMAYYLLGHHEEAVEALQGALVRTPNFLFAHVCLAAVYSAVGREAAARAEVDTIHQLSPDFSLAALQQRTGFKDPATTQRFLAHLRQAGLY